MASKRASTDSKSNVSPQVGTVVFPGDRIELNQGSKARIGPGVIACPNPSNPLAPVASTRAGPLCQSFGNRLVVNALQKRVR